MINEKPKITVNQKLGIEQPKDTECRAIHLSDWQHLVKKIKRIKSPIYL